MENLAWILWTILGIILIIAEIFTVGFVLLWFGVGAFGAALCSFLGFGYVVQFLVFAILSVSLTALSRQIFRQDKNERELTSGMDNIIGKVGTVTEGSEGSLNKGAVKVFGSIWTAYPIDGEDLKEGERVEVRRIEGSSIYVAKYKELPEWRSEEEN